MIHQVGPTRVFAASVCTQGITKLVNALCLDWLENADSSLRFDHIYVRWHDMYHVVKIGYDIRNCFYFSAHFNE